MEEPIWERQPGETPKAFAAFSIYRDMHTPTDTRSIGKVAKRHNINKRTMEKWSSKYHWQERVDAYDREIDRQNQAKHLQEIEKMNEEHASIGKAMLVKAVKALQRIELDEIRAADISRMVETGAKLERISRGASDEVVEMRDGGKAVNPVSFYIPSNGRDQEEGEGDE